MESSEGSLTHTAGGGGCHPEHLYVPSPHSAWASSWRDGQVPRTRDQKEAAEAVAPFMTYTEKSHGVTSARVTSPVISKGKEHTVYLSVGQLSKITL